METTMFRREAATENRSAKLSTDFGYDFAVRLFGQDAIDSLPIITRGPNKGRPAGYLIWLKTTEAGYSPYTGGGTAAGVTVRAWIGAGPFAGQSDALRGDWCGRREVLCLSRCYLGEEGRARRLGEAR